MSLEFMAAAWASGAPPTERYVLLALADWADAAGRCWPSIPTIAGKTGLAPRTVRRALRWLEGASLLAAVHRNGRGTVCTLTPANLTPVRVTPAIVTPTPANVTPNTSKTRQKVDSSHAGAGEPFPMPDGLGIDPDDWRDFKANRQRRRMADTAAAHRALLRDLAREASAEWPAARLIEHAAGKGWGSVHHPDKEMRGAARRDRPDAGAVAAPSRGYGADMLAAALARPDDPEGDPSTGGRAEGAVPAWLRG